MARKGLVLAAMLGLSILAGCGVDGAPLRPAPPPGVAAPGATVSGEAQIGVTGRL
ncbi:hypothetical protein [Paracoccus pacificus]|uniref:Argininosuccinate lyase n=1 Tax=Paracoccus pacificus TaxID=1463598 RepID=A0ABW4R3F9_9RHOB